MSAFCLKPEVAKFDETAVCKKGFNESVPTQRDALPGSGCSYCLGIVAKSKHRSQVARFPAEAGEPVAPSVPALIRNVGFDKLIVAVRKISGEMGSGILWRTHRK